MVAPECYPFLHYSAIGGWGNRVRLSCVPIGKVKDGIEKQSQSEPGRKLFVNVLVNPANFRSIINAIRSKNSFAKNIKKPTIIRFH